VFIQALESVGIQISLGNFKRKRVRCKASCGLEGWGYEEKESDVNLALTGITTVLKKKLKH
jgi:hypothetical protein